MTSMVRLASRRVNENRNQERHEYTPLNDLEVCGVISPEMSRAALTAALIDAKSLDLDPNNLCSRAETISGWRNQTYAYALA